MRLKITISTGMEARGLDPCDGCRAILTCTDHRRGLLMSNSLGEELYSWLVTNRAGSQQSGALGPFLSQAKSSDLGISESIGAWNILRHKGRKMSPCLHLVLTAYPSLNSGGGRTLVRTRESCSLLAFPPTPISSSQVIKPPPFCGSWTAGLPGDSFAAA